MALYRVTSPHGERYHVRGPDDATPEQVHAVVAAHLRQFQAGATPTTPDPAPSRTPLRGVADPRRTPLDPQARPAGVIGTPHCPGGGRIQRMLVTGYDNGFESTGKHPQDPGYGLTADRSTAGPGTIAAPRGIPYGTRMYVPDYGPATVHDRGGAIRNAHIDLWFPSAEAARRWGAPHKDVEVCR